MYESVTVPPLVIAGIVAILVVGYMVSWGIGECIYANKQRDDASTHRESLNEDDEDR